MRIALTAPTGKAAARLQEVISQVAERWCKDPRVKRELGTRCGIVSPVHLRAMTIHRLLGSLPHSSRFRHDAGNPLPVDVVVVDEASMVDLPLLAKLIRALPEQARLILLGDRNQLASMEAGAVLSDICGDQPLNRFSPDFADRIASLTGCSAGAAPMAPAMEGSSVIRDSLVELQTNYRFPEESGIHRLSLAVNQGEGEAALSALKEKGCDDCRWMRIPPAGDLSQHLKGTLIKHFKQYMEHTDNISEYDNLFTMFSRFRILCALRRGPYGVTEINRLCERILFEEGLTRRGVPCGCLPFLWIRPRIGRLDHVPVVVVQA